MLLNVVSFCCCLTLELQQRVLNFLIEFLVKQFVDLLACRDVQKQKALVKSESLLTILSGEFLPTNFLNCRLLISAALFLQTFLHLI